MRFIPTGANLRAAGWRGLKARQRSEPGIRREVVLRWSLRLAALTSALLLLFLSGALVGSLLVRGQRQPAASSDGAATLLAESFAERFALSYATYDSADWAGYSARLDGYGSRLGDGLWNGSGKQVAVAVVVDGSARRSDGVRVVRAAVEVESTPTTQGATPVTRWLELAVPVVSNGTEVTVVGKPALLPAPALAAPPVAKQRVDDAALEQSLHDDLAAFFRAYASGDSSELAYFTAPGVRLSGLGGEVQLQQLSGLVIEQDGQQGSRVADCEVVWHDQTTGAALEQSYRLQLVPVGGQWHVAAVDAAGRGAASGA
ncbi:MAG: conjugal transfer protein [Candidatus Dormibacteraeota bacterium]|nr:conjugal transfer protein [Candidatus Dormibacteraeota bacterium]